MANRASSPLVRLVDSYRRHGHRAALLDPLKLTPRPPVAALDPRRYGFALSDQLEAEYTSVALPEVQPHLSDSNKQWATSGILYGINDHHTVGEVAKRLQEVYCGPIAYEFMHLPVRCRAMLYVSVMAHPRLRTCTQNKHEREWIARTLETMHAAPFTKDEQLAHFRLLAKSESFDHFCQKRFPNLKRYSLEWVHDRSIFKHCVTYVSFNLLNVSRRGAESMLIALDRIFRDASANGIQETVL